MALVIKRKTATKAYKGKRYSYTVYELHKVFRNPSNKGKVVSQFLAYLGKDPKSPAAMERLKRLKQESQGHFSVERLSRKIDKELQKDSAE